MVDCDDCYGDLKNVAHVVRSYEDMGISAIFIEDQVAPKRCGHMAGKQVIPAELMEEKIVTAVGCRRTDLFVMARTNARAVGPGRGSAAWRALLQGRYRRAVFKVPKDEAELERIASAFRGRPLVVNMLRGGGKTPLTPPTDLHATGFSMVFHPTSLIFVVTKAPQGALRDIKAGCYPVE